MTTPSPETLDREKDKRFVTDAELCRLLGVPARIAKPTIQELETKHGFPKKLKLWGNRRYLPAVLAYLDAQNMPRKMANPPHQRDRHE